VPADSCPSLVRINLTLESFLSHLEEFFDLVQGGLSNSFLNLQFENLAWSVQL
jgi:hypothetical protein